MKKVAPFLVLLVCLIRSQSLPPSEFWKSYSQEEKISFINGAYGAISRLKSHHQSEVRKQFLHDDNWVEPYYIERFYDIVDEYLSQDVGYNLTIIAMHMDAFYSNSDNLDIPILESLRIVSLMQDGEKKVANVRLLRAQQKYAR